MKIIISENRVNQVIRKYLDETFYPDYGWDNPDFYQKDVKQYGSYEFQINDETAYVYYNTKTLEIYPWLDEKLTSLFGDKWLPVFKEWFEENSGLKVKKIEK